MRKMSWTVQIFTVFKQMVVPFAPKTGEICTVQIVLQPIPFKSDRLLACSIVISFEDIAIIFNAQSRQANSDSGSLMWA
jgi:hypothetical protein